MTCSKYVPSQSHFSWECWEFLDALRIWPDHQAVDDEEASPSATQQQSSNWPK